VVVHEQESSWAGKRLDDPDFTGARLHGPSFEGARITDGWFKGADISGDLQDLRLNGVEVGPLVDAELDRLFPDRVRLRATDRDGLLEAWTMLEQMWDTTVVRARGLPPALLDTRVDGEWSFVETLRHLVMATDIWLRRMVEGRERPYHPWGLAGSWVTHPASLGLDPSAEPSLDEVLDVRRERMAEVRVCLNRVTDQELSRVCVPPDAPGGPVVPHQVVKCLHVIFAEEWEHHRYAVRDLAILESRS